MPTWFLTQTCPLSGESIIVHSSSEKIGRHVLLSSYWQIGRYTKKWSTNSIAWQHSPCMSNSTKYLFYATQSIHMNQNFHHVYGMFDRYTSKCRSRLLRAHFMKIQVNV